MLLTKPKIVVIGGGTGNFVVLSGLRKYPVDLTALVSVMDSGGSTGRLRTEFGFLPVGDMRQCLAALANEEGKDYIRKLLLYRFGKGKGLEGHNLGNLLLTALTELTGSEPKAVEKAAKIFRLHGQVLPITTTNTQLVVWYEDGKKIVGEHEIDEPKHIGGKKIVKLETLPPARVYDEAKKEILKARLIILGPGDLYTSILPNLVIKGVSLAMKQSRAKIIYIVNLMTRYSQTDKLTVSDHITKIEKYLGKSLNYVLLNTSKIPKYILKLYQKEKGYPVVNDLGRGDHFKIIKKDLLAPAVVYKPKGDILTRSYLRHDPKKLARTIISLIK